MTTIIRPIASRVALFRQIGNGGGRIRDSGLAVTKSSPKHRTARSLLSRTHMGRIRTTRKEDYTIVIVEGRLTAADMGRLEHACSHELICSTPRLEIDLSRVTYIDDTALALLRRMAERGAVLRTDAAAAELC